MPANIMDVISAILPLSGPSKLGGEVVRIALPRSSCLVELHFEVVLDDPFEYLLERPLQEGFERLPTAYGHEADQVAHLAKRLDVLRGVLVRVRGVSARR